MVTKGYIQVIEEDYAKTYALVARLESVRLVCTIAALQRLRLQQVDFISAFLNSDSSFKVFMEQPKGFEERDNEYVWKLKKTLYSIMQEVYNWAINLNKIFKDLGYYKSKVDLQIQS